MLSDRAYAKKKTKGWKYFDLVFFLSSQKHGNCLSENNQKWCSQCPVTGVPREHSRDLTQKIYLKKHPGFDFQTVFQYGLPYYVWY